MSVKLKYIASNWEKAMAPHSSTLAWKIPWTEEPGGLQSMGSLGVRHDWATSLSLFTFMHWRRTWQPTPVFLPGESQGRWSLVGCHLWGRTELDTKEAIWQQQQQQPVIDWGPSNFVNSASVSLWYLYTIAGFCHFWMSWFLLRKIEITFFALLHVVFMVHQKFLQLIQILEAWFGSISISALEQSMYAWVLSGLSHVWP